MSNVKEIRQIRNNFAKALDTTFDQKGQEFSSFPGATVVKQIYKKNGLFVNGLTEEQENRIGKILNVDLSKTSSFWDDFKIKLIDGNKTVSFDLDNPTGLISYNAGLACKFFAESLHMLKEVGYKDRDCYLYVFDPIGEIKLKADLELNKDECISKLYAAKGNQEKLFLMCTKLDIFVSEKSSLSTLYLALKGHLEKLNKDEKVSEFKELLNTNVLELEIAYNVKKSIERGIIKYINGQWMFGAIIFGSSQSSIADYFLIKANSSNYVTLKNELESNKK